MHTYMQLSSYRHNILLFEQGHYTSILNSTTLTTASIQYQKCFTIWSIMTAMELTLTHKKRLTPTTSSMFLESPYFLYLMG